MRDPNGNVVTKFDLPADLPEPVAAAQATFHDLAGKLIAARDQVRASDRAIEQARSADLEAAGQLVAAGKAEGSDPHKGERTAREAAQKLRDEVGTLEAATDIAGDRLVEAIDEARDQWLEDLRVQVNKGSEQYRKSIDQAGAALNALSGSSEVIPWLSGFAAWKVNSTTMGVRRSAEFSSQLPPELAQAFAGLSSLGAAARAPESMAA